MFRSLRQMIQSECKSSKDFFRSSSDVHGRPCLASSVGGVIVCRLVRKNCQRAWLSGTATLGSCLEGTGSAGCDFVRRACTAIVVENGRVVRQVWIARLHERCISIECLFHGCADDVARYLFFDRRHEKRGISCAELELEMVMQNATRASVYERIREGGSTLRLRRTASCTRDLDEITQLPASAAICDVRH